MTFKVNGQNWKLTTDKPWSRLAMHGWSLFWKPLLVLKYFDWWTDTQWIHMSSQHWLWINILQWRRAEPAFHHPFYSTIFNELLQCSNIITGEFIFQRFSHLLSNIYVNTSILRYFSLITENKLQICLCPNLFHFKCIYD